jgi:hypothetical protein
MPTKTAFHAPEGALGLRNLPQKCPHPFWRDESGAVTVDWFFLTIALVAMVGALFSTLTPKLVGWIESAFI